MHQFRTVVSDILSFLSNHVIISKFKLYLLFYVHIFLYFTLCKLKKMCVFLPSVYQDKYTGLPTATKDEASETIVRNLCCLVSYFLYLFCKLMSFQIITVSFFVGNPIFSQNNLKFLSHG